MRVVAGLYRGCVLLQPINAGVRPTTDRVKESLFNILNSKNALKGAVLDLFCGSGALGIEAISRGVDSCVFVDNQLTSTQLTQSNINKLKIQNGKVVHMDSFSAIKQFGDNKIMFDLILADPPYSKNYGATILDSIIRNDILAPNGLITIERDSGVEIINDARFECIDSRKFGNTTIDFFITNN